MTNLSPPEIGGKPLNQPRTALRAFHRKQLLMRRGALLTQWHHLFPAHHFGDLRLIDVPAPLRPKPPAPRPTPQVTIEAIMICVRERGISALKEPENIERLLRCDAAAKAQIEHRIENLAKLKGFPQ
jgi:hypothetical protein